MSAWLDVRAHDERTLAALVAAAAAAAADHARATGTTVDLTTESTSPAVAFDSTLRTDVETAFGTSERGPLPVIATAAGHDAGVLASVGIPSAMLFVRNRTGVSHAPTEHADRDDCLTGIAALARAIERLACMPTTPLAPPPA